MWLDMNALYVDLAFGGKKEVKKMCKRCGGKQKKNGRKCCVCRKDVLPLHPQSKRWRDSSAG